MTHYDTLFAMKAALEKACRIDKEAMIDALEGLVIQSPTGSVTIGKNHRVTMNMFLAKTEGSSLLTVRSLGEIAPEPGCKSDD
jgi:urea transport system substrate-binding protein